MEEELRALLLADSGITELCGHRVDWGAYQQGADLPGIALHLIDGAEGYTYQGTDRLFRGRVQIDACDSTYKGATILSRAVIDLLGGYSGGNFEGVFHISTRSGREGGSNEAGRPFRISMDFTVNWRTSNA